MRATFGWTVTSDSERDDAHGDNGNNDHQYDDNVADADDAVHVASAEAGVNRAERQTHKGPKTQSRENRQKSKAAPKVKRGTGRINMEALACVLAEPEELNIHEGDEEWAAELGTGIGSGPDFVTLMGIGDDADVYG